MLLSISNEELVISDTLRVENSDIKIERNIAPPIGQRMLNYTVACFVLLVLLMPFGIIAVLIKSDSPGPVFFRQPRIGYRNQVFYIWKFRSMYADSSDLAGGRLTERNDPRMTLVGIAAGMVARRIAASVQRLCRRDGLGRTASACARSQGRQHAVCPGGARLSPPTSGAAGDQRLGSGQWLARRDHHDTSDRAASAPRSRIHRSSIAVVRLAYFVAYCRVLWFGTEIRRFRRFRGNPMNDMDGRFAEQAASWADD